MKKVIDFRSFPLDLSKFPNEEILCNPPLFARFTRTWKYALDAVQGLHNDGDLVDVDHAVVVNIIQLEGPVHLLSVCTTQMYQ